MNVSNGALGMDPPSKSACLQQRFRRSPQLYSGGDEVVVLTVGAPAFASDGADQPHARRNLPLDPKRAAAHVVAISSSDLEAFLAVFDKVVKGVSTEGQLCSNEPAGLLDLGLVVQ